MSISGRQIRGARGLLGWSMEELADKCELTRLTIRQIENETVQPQERTLARILTVLDQEGIEFTENEGVCVRKHQMRTYSGKAGYRQLLDHIYETLRKGGRIRQFNFGDDRYMPIDDYAAEHIKRMEAIEGLDAKVLVQKSELGTPLSYCSYKILDDEFKDVASWYLYGDYLVLPLNDGTARRECVTIYSKQVAQRYSREFDAFWAKSSGLPKKKRK
ncbi:MAG: helix-turn-helix domain-containing protein [Alphaproteobacteria bacterium]|nr:helix-turn-helix domain-containing protein [Alphaproteobacteria bacterium]